MKSRIKLDVDYYNNPKLVFDVYRTDNVLDKLMNKFIDEFDYNKLVDFGNQIRTKGFLADINLVEPAECYGSEKDNSNFRGTFTLIPLSRKGGSIQKCYEEGNEPYQNPDEQITLTTTKDWFYQIDKSAENVKETLKYFNQDTGDINYIINSLKECTENEIDGLVRPTPLRSIDSKKIKYKACSNCGEDPYSFYENKYGGEPIKEKHKSIKNHVDDDVQELQCRGVVEEEVDPMKYTESFSRKDIFLKLNRIEGLLLEFNCDLQDINDVKDFIKII